MTNRDNCEPQPLTVSHLSFWYSNSEPATVFECTFSVAPRNFVAIVGESGSGKTTLLRLACGILQAEIEETPERRYRIEGTVAFGSDVLKKPHHTFSYVPQNFEAGLLESLTGRDNILLSIRGQHILAENLQEADKLLGTAGIYDKAHRRVWQMSGGEKQRVAICRALLPQPQMLFMDEPFANLDSTLKPTLSDFLMKLRHECSLSSLLMVTHDIEHVIGLTDMIVGIRSTYALPQYVSWNKKPFDRREIETYIGTKR